MFFGSKVLNDLIYELKGLVFLSLVLLLHPCFNFSTKTLTDALLFLLFSITVQCGGDVQMDKGLEPQLAENLAVWHLL